mgnify:CR=1 FL=1
MCDDLDNFGQKPTFLFLISTYYKLAFAIWSLPVLIFLECDGCSSALFPCRHPVHCFSTQAFKASSWSQVGLLHHFIDLQISTDDSWRGAWWCDGSCNRMFDHSLKPRPSGKSLYQNDMSFRYWLPKQRRCWVKQQTSFNHYRTEQLPSIRFHFHSDNVLVFFFFFFFPHSLYCNVKGNFLACVSLCILRYSGHILWYSRILWS